MYTYTPPPKLHILDFWALCFVVVFMIEGTWLYSHRENKQCIMTQCVSSASTKIVWLYLALVLAWKYLSQYQLAEDTQCNTA